MIRALKNNNKKTSSTIYIIGNHFRMATILLRRVRELFCSQIIVVYCAPNKHLDQPGNRQSMVSFRCPRTESKDPQPNRCPHEERASSARTSIAPLCAHSLTNDFVSSTAQVILCIHDICSWSSSARATREDASKEWIRRVMIKPVFRVTDKVRHNTGWTTKEHVYRLGMSDLGSRGIVLSI